MSLRTLYGPARCAVRRIIARGCDLLIEVVGSVPIVVGGERHARSIQIEQPLGAWPKFPGVVGLSSGDEVAPKSVI